MYCHAAKERSFIDCLRRYYVAALRSLNCVLALAKQREQCLLCDATYFLAKVAQVFILYKDLREQKLSSLRKVRKRASPHKSRGPAQIFFSFSVSLLLCSTVCKNPNKTWYLLRYRVFCRVFFLPSVQFLWCCLKQSWLRSRTTHFCMRIRKYSGDFIKTRKPIFQLFRLFPHCCALYYSAVQPSVALQLYFQ